MKTCRTCGVELVRGAKEYPGRFANRQHCSCRCANTGRNIERHTAAREALIEEIEWMLPHTKPYDILRAVGYQKARSLSRRLQRAGRYDLARAFERQDVA